MTTAMSLHDGHVQMARTWKTFVLALSCKHHTGARPPCKLLPPQSVCTAPFCTKEQATTCNAAPTNTNSCAHAMHAKATYAAANTAPAGNTAHRSVGLDAQAVWGERLTTPKVVEPYASFHIFSLTATTTVFADSHSLSDARCNRETCSDQLLLPMAITQSLTQTR